jgi:DnaJ-class molecular chaperone
VIKLAEVPHKKFKREGNDLIYLHKLSLCDSLLSRPIHFRTIDDEEIEVAVDEVISPTTQKIVKGKGMPILSNDPLGPLKKTYQRGNLIIKFDIEFPL